MCSARHICTLNQLAEIQRISQPLILKTLYFVLLAKRKQGKETLKTQRKNKMKALCSRLDSTDRLLVANNTKYSMDSVTTPIRLIIFSCGWQWGEYSIRHCSSLYTLRNNALHLNAIIDSLQGSLYSSSLCSRWSAIW